MDVSDVRVLTCVIGKFACGSSDSPVDVGYEGRKSDIREYVLYIGDYILSRTTH